MPRDSAPYRAEPLVTLNEAGSFQVARRAYTDPDVFALEMERIFESSWVFLAFEAQLPNPGDFVATAIGRQPVLVTRDQAGAVHGLLNSCRHKGARVCTREAGNAKLFVCPYHSWSYGLDGTLKAIKDQSDGGYPDGFAAADHNLHRIARLERYRGLIFGSLQSDVPPLESYLGDTQVLIDLIMDQSEDGIELVPGRNVFSYNGNWKLQLENGMDPYHLTSAHQSFMQIVAGREKSQSATNAIRTRDFRRTVGADGGVFCFPHGHGAIWIHNETPERKPIHTQYDRLVERLGQRRADWVMNFRNLVIFPNLQLADSESLLLRVIRPIAVDRTEVYLYCIAPAGEDPDARRLRLRQYEDFFNVSGLATPDDAAVYEECQAGFAAAPSDRLQGFDRGAALMQAEADEAARSLGISPESVIAGGFKIQSEIQMRAAYREWCRLMPASLSAGLSEGGAGDE